MLTTRVCEIIVQGTLPTTGSGSKNIANVFHYVAGTGGAIGSAVDLANNFLTNVWALIAAQLSVDYTGVATITRFLDDATVQYVNANVPASGAIALPRLPTEVSIVCPLRASERGKHYRGSKHFAGVPTASVVKDELTAGAAAAWAASVTALGNALTPGGGYTVAMFPCVLSRSLSQTRVNPTSLWAATIASVLLNKTIGTMRKRKERTVR